MGDMTTHTDFENGFKALRNRLRSVKRDEFILGLIHTLRNDEGTPVEEYAKGKPMPWTLLTLLKLTCEFGGTNDNARKALNNDFVKIYNMAYDLEGNYSSTILKENFNSFFLLLCHMQFWHQQEIIRSVFSRVDYFFCTGAAAKQLDEWFTSEYSIKCSEFIELLTVTWIYWKTHSVFSCTLAEQLKAFKYEDTVINKFIAMVSVSLNKVQSFVEDRPSPIRSYFLQFGERTPFLFAPILKVSDTDYVLISMRLLERSIAYFIFERIKRSKNEKVIQCFADTFEEYVHQLLVDANFDPWCANELEDTFPGKSTDFAFCCGEKTIFIECKSIRLSPIAVANPTQEILVNDIKDSICKAIEQCYELSIELYSRCGNIEPYLIIVTYDDVYLGEPQRTWDGFLKEYFVTKGTDDKIAGMIPPERIFTVGLQEFETLCEVCKGWEHLDSLLSNAIKNNAKSETSRYSLLMHIQPTEKRKPTTVTKQHFRGLFQRLVSKIKK